MMLSRKEFLKLSGVATGALLLNPIGLMCKRQADNEEKLNLLFSPDEIPAIKRRWNHLSFKNSGRKP